ncbi:MAG: tail fiber domain-containing protein [Ekhidna sp.]
MKLLKKATAVVFFLSYLFSNAQDNSVGINTNSPNANAVLELVSPNSNQGFLVPRVNSSQRSLMSGSLSNLDDGLMVFDTDLNVFYYWNNGNWRAGLGILNALTAGGDLVGAYPNPLIGLAKVTEEKIADQAVSNTKLGNGSVTTDKISDNAVTTDKIVNQAITGGKLEDIGSINAGTYGTETFNVLQLTVDQKGRITGISEVVINIGSGNITNGSILNEDIANSTITISKINSGLGNQNSVLTTDASGVPRWTNRSEFASSALSQNNIYIGSVAGVAQGLPVIGDVSALNTGSAADIQINPSAVGTTEIVNGSITNEDLNKSSIPLSGFGDAVDNVNLGNNKLINVADPSNSQDASSKNYVDTEIADINTESDADSTAIWNKVQADSTYLDDRIATNITDIANLDAEVDADSLALYTKLQVDSTYLDDRIATNITDIADINTESDADSTAIWNKVQADSTYLDDRIATNITDIATLDAEVDADSLALYTKLQVDSTYLDDRIATNITDIAGKQDNDAALTSIAGLTTSGGEIIYTNASDSYTTATLTPAGRAILDDTDATAQRTTLGLGSLATLNSVSATEIASDAVGADEIIDGSITNNEIALNTIIADDIATGAVTTQEILDGTISFADMAQNGATNGQVMKWNNVLSVWESADDVAVSDARFKRDIVAIPEALAKILAIRGVNYFFRSEEFQSYQFSDKKQYGVIAQELKKVFPELVSKGKEGYYRVNYEQLIPVLVAAMQEQQEQINSLNKKVTSQESKLSELESDNKEMKSDLDLIKKMLIGDPAAKKEDK